MSTVLEQLRVWIESLVTALGYPGLAIVMFIETIFPPIPSELVLPFAGFLAAQGRFSIVLVVLVTTGGALVGALLLYWLGMKWGEHRTRELVRAHGRWLLLSVEDFDRALELFRRHERPVVFWARMLPLMRSLISLPAGITHMPLGSFVLFTVLGTLTWNLVLAGAGMLLGANWTQVLDIVDRFEIVFWILILGLVLTWVGVKLTRRKKA